MLDLWFMHVTVHDVQALRVLKISSRPVLKGARSIGSCPLQQRVLGFQVHTQLDHPPCLDLIVAPSQQESLNIVSQVEQTAHNFTIW